MPVQLPVKERSQLQPMAAHRASSATSIIDTLPANLVLYLASPYLAGKDSRQALNKASDIYRRDGFSATLDILGEDAACVEDCQAYVATYRRVIGEVAASSADGQAGKRRPSVSMKPSMFSCVAPAADMETKRQLQDAFERIREVVAYAKEKGVEVTLEAEDARWTDFHLNTYFALTGAGYNNLGTVLQTRLFRTREDVEKFGEGMRVRLVIGIYKEPANIAYEDKAKMKDLLVEYAGRLLAKGTYVEVATHDSQCLEKFVGNVVIPGKIPASQFECQFLLGVPRMKLERALLSGAYFRSFPGVFDKDKEAHLEALSQSGILVRLYLPFGQDKVAAPYCKRRLKNNPNMIGYGIKNLLRIES
jgi:proline dehydrogenase